MIKRWSDEAWEDYLYWQTQDRKTLRKINELIKNIERTADGRIGKAEMLKYDKKGWYSVRIDQTNRMVYRIVDGILEIAQCKDHYKD